MRAYAFNGNTSTFCEHLNEATNQSAQLCTIADINTAATTMTNLVVPLEFPFSPGSE